MKIRHLKNGDIFPPLFKRGLWGGLCGLTFLTLATVTFLSLSSQPSQAQQTETHPAARAPTETQLPQTTYWKFGLIVTGSGPTSGVQATLPVPTAWPDQSVDIVSLDKSPLVSTAKLKKLGKDAQQLYFKVPRMAGGDVVEASVTLKITKLESLAPVDTSIFEFAQPAPSKIRKYLEPSPFIESRHARIRELAKQIPVKSDDDAWDQVLTIYEWVRENIEYKFDTEIRSCLDALDSGHGDCEEMSSLFIAICRARNIPARAVWIPDHTYPEFYLQDKNGEGHWFPCQAAGSYAFGQMPEAKPILQKGDKFRVSGHRNPIRYIQPTLKARDAASAPTIQWIMTQVESPASRDK